MKRIAILLIAITLCLSACGFHTQEQSTHSSYVQLADWEGWSEYDSPQSLLQEMKSNPRNVSNLDYFYVPNIPLAYSLWQIRVNKPYVTLFYSQHGGKNFSDIEPYIEVCYYRTDYSKTDATLERLKFGLTPTEDGYYYNKAKSTILFSVENDWISITVPGGLNNYDTLKEMCTVKRYPD